MHLTLQRLNDNGLRTRGTLLLGGTLLHTLEEPWKNNQVGQSCIPTGTYEVVPHGWEPNTKLHQKRAYRLLGTSPREGILIHSGNTVDDIEGCILIGMGTGILAGKDAVVRSRDAMDLLRRTVAQNYFMLTILPVK